MCANTKHKDYNLFKVIARGEIIPIYRVYRKVHPPPQTGRALCVASFFGKLLRGNICWRAHLLREL